MRSRITVVVISSAVLIAALFISFIAGVHVGVYQFYQMDSSAKALLLVHDLRALRSGANEKLIKVKEVELDGLITQALRFQEFGQSWLFWPFSNGYEHGDYLKKVAIYRKEHPSNTHKLGIDGEENHSEEMEIYRSEVVKRTTQLIEQYGR